MVTFTSGPGGRAVGLRRVGEDPVEPTDKSKEGIGVSVQSVKGP